VARRDEIMPVMARAEVVAWLVVELRAWKVRRPFWLMVNAVYVDVAKVEGEDVAR
jgi:hypothetical protein